MLFSVTCTCIDNIMKWYSHAFGDLPGDHRHWYLLIANGRSPANLRPHCQVSWKWARHHRCQPDITPRYVMSHLNQQGQTHRIVRAGKMQPDLPNSAFVWISVGLFWKGAFSLITSFDFVLSLLLTHVVCMKPTLSCLNVSSLRNTDFDANVIVDLRCYHFHT